MILNPLLALYSGLCGNASRRITMNIDVLGSVEFDLTEAIKDLISQIKFNRQEIEEIKKQLVELNSTKG